MNSEKAQLSWFKTLLINAAASVGFSSSHWLACSKKTGEGHGAVRKLSSFKEIKWWLHQQKTKSYLWQNYNFPAENYK